MICERIANDENETANWYKQVNVEEELDNKERENRDNEVEIMNRKRAEVELHNCLFENFYHGTAVNFEAKQQHRCDALLPFCYQVALVGIA